MLLLGMREEEGRGGDGGQQEEAGWGGGGGGRLSQCVTGTEGGCITNLHLHQADWTRTAAGRPCRAFGIPL